MITKELSVDDTETIVSLDELCEHSRITDLYDEIVVQQCLDTAHDVVQNWLNRKLYPTQIIGQVEQITNEIQLTFPTIHNVVSISASDSNWDTVYLTQTTDWVFDEIFNTVRFKSHVDNTLTHVRIIYNCGFNPATDPVPHAVKHAILMTAATLYENREDVIIGTQINNVPLDAQRLLRVHRSRPSFG